MDLRAVSARVERYVRRLELIPPGGEVTCLVSGGADSTCLWHALRELGYRVSALHVNHGLRGAESDEDARFCRNRLGADVIDAPPARTEDELRELRYSLTAGGGLRATGHTASDLPGLEVRRWKPGDRLRGRRKKVQDVFVDAKVPRRARRTWPLVVQNDEVVCVPGIVEDPAVRWERDADAD